MTWEYAIMSKKMAKAGGPQQWEMKIRARAYNQGVVDAKNKITIPLFLCGAGAGIILNNAIEFYCKEKKIKKENMCNAEELLLEAPKNNCKMIEENGYDVDDYEADYEIIEVDED